MRLILRNVPAPEIQALSERIDMLGCENLGEICTRIRKLVREDTTLCDCIECGGETTFSIPSTPKIIATEPSETVKMDKKGNTSLSFLN